jgi:predicted metal-dependent enzyme (double-stranded beta helix superfamily)
VLTAEQRLGSPDDYCAHNLYVEPNIHRVRNTADETAISIHVYGTDVTRVGSSARRYYD